MQIKICSLSLATVKITSALSLSGTISCNVTTQEDEVAQKIMNAINSGHPHVKTSQGKISLQETSVKDQLVFLNDCIWVPEPFIAEVIKETHAQIATGLLQYYHSLTGL